MTESPDNITLSALREGDEKALRSIFDRYYSVLLGDIYRIIPDEDTCQDLTQEVFIELWKKRAGLEIHTSLRAYLRRAAVNRALNYLKTNKRLVFDDPPEEAQDEWQERHIKEERADLENALYQAIEKLPERCRVVFSLSRFEDLSHKEIAERLNISVKTIENQITKAMRMLREALTVLALLSPAVISWLKWLGKT